MIRPLDPESRHWPQKIAWLERQYLAQPEPGGDERAAEGAEPGDPVAVGGQEQRVQIRQSESLHHRPSPRPEPPAAPCAGFITISPSISASVRTVDSAAW